MTTGLDSSHQLDRSAVMSLKLVALVLLFAAAPLPAKPAGLTVKTGETWLFNLSGGQPVKARKVSANAKPAAGQIVVTVRSMMGTTMTITSNNPAAYTYKAELIGAGKVVPTRSCTLPANSRLSFENWPQKASAVRLSDFKVATKDGACP
jgi:hypothetical protein